MGCRLTKDEPSNDVQTNSNVDEIHTDKIMEKINFKYRLERKMCIAKETPEADFDLSDCNLKNIPPGVFIHCRILLKETLNLSKNHLTFFNSNVSNGGMLNDLSKLKILNLNFNKIKQLPDEIYLLQNLREFFISNNNLTRLPRTINCLKYLEILDVSSNNLLAIDEINCMLNLRTLNVKDNRNLKNIPGSLSTCVLLCDLIIDCATTEWSSSDVCDSNLTVINENLSMGKMDQSVNTIKNDTSQLNMENALKESQAHENLTYCNNKRSNNYLNFVKSQCEDENDLIEEVQSKQKKLKENLLEIVLMQQNENDLRLNEIQKQKDLERSNLIKNLIHEEESTNVIIDKFLALKNSSDSALVEKEKLEEERLLEKLHLDLSDLRKQEILVIMMKTLNDEEAKIQTYQEQRSASASNILEREQVIMKDLGKFYENYARNRTATVERISNDEELQKQAVIVLIENNDARTWGLVEQLKIVENQLSKLTKLEIQKKHHSTAEQMNDLAEQRIQLSFILVDLLDQQEQRKKQLFNTLLEIEAQKLTEQQDFWLMQYQKLLDSQPIEFSMKLNSIDLSLSYYFLINGVIHCLPFLQKLLQNNEICLEKIKDEDLKSAGIQNEKDRFIILKSIEEFIEMQKNIKTNLDQPTAPSLKLNSSMNNNSECGPSTSSITQTQESISAEKNFETSPNTECVICMEEEVKVIFLPCGHMCCCLNCKEKIELCPICRASIERKVKVLQP